MRFRYHQRTSFRSSGMCKACLELRNVVAVFLFDGASDLDPERDTHRRQLGQRSGLTTGTIDFLQ